MMKDGFARNGKQRYRCASCGKRSRENPDQGHSPQFQEQVLKAYAERMSMRGIARTFGISRNTLVQWLKKRPSNLGGTE
jgi:transposase-like protein